MNIIRTTLKTTAILFVVVSFFSCENDFDSLGTDIIGEPGFNADLYEDTEIAASTRRFEAVQTSNLPVHLLGVYKDPVFGTQISNVLSQVFLTTPNPNFGNEPVLDSVVLNVPYFSTEGETDEDGVVSYRLDSIYGNSPIRLSVLHSNLFLNPLDPSTDFQSTQRYYSNIQPRIESNLTGNVLFETENFRPSPEAVTVYELNDQGERDTLSLAPRMRIRLDNKFFQEYVLNKAGSPELSGNNSFQNFLRGLYIKSEPVNNDGTMMMLNFRHSEAGITLYYTSMRIDTQDRDDDDDVTEMIATPGSYELKFGQTIVNTFEQEVPEYNDDKLYLRGGEGSMAVIELFSGPDEDNNGVSDELEFLRENNWLINEANLIFHVDRSKMQGLREPERIFLFDVKNRTVLADYVFDSPGQTNVFTSVTNNEHLGVLQRDENGEGLRYKMRITRHVRNILANDSTNVRLGLVVTQNVNVVSNVAVMETGERPVTRIPAGSVVSPLGTVLHGPDAEDEEKRLKLRIYYTEPKD